ncbi:MAG TPA: L-glutamate gamma-semialdehyde dehydrogenase [Polyangiaceae bacterium]|nr:L-glutamate gamma-semialdehyde dehydrogenase [Polyangiaceae bacterium]
MLPANEPVWSYAPGSPERAAIQRELQRQAESPVFVPMRIGGDAFAGESSLALRAPHRHALLLGEAAQGGRAEMQRAIQAALTARAEWARRSQSARSAVFLRAAELLAGRYRQTLNAATMLGQSKTVHQAEIDAACELCDFFRFNAHHAEELCEGRLGGDLRSPAGQRNTWDYRPLEGFVYAVTPFNFTAIAGNLVSLPALLGNVVVWKPSPYAVLSAHYLLQLLREAGLPEGVVQFVMGDAEALSEEALQHKQLSGLHFTGSTRVLKKLSQRVAENLPNYREFPRVVGETGGKGFIVAHKSAELDALCVATLRGGFEYQGQKCSAVTRVYVPRSLAVGFERRLLELLASVKVGDPTDFSNFMAAVISRDAFDRLSLAIERARQDRTCRVAAGGGCSDEAGFFVEPTLIQVLSPRHTLLSEELFGPVVAFYVYDDDRFEEVLGACDSGSDYALTGAIFARDPAAIETACSTLRYSAGNFYVNDKPTGAVVGQQPFGGSRQSGTNDKAGSAQHLLRWVSPRVIKENFAPPTDYRYPYLLKDSGNE